MLFRSFLDVSQMGQGLQDYVKIVPGQMEYYIRIGAAALPHFPSGAYTVVVEVEDADNALTAQAVTLEIANPAPTALAWQTTLAAGGSASVATTELAAVAHPHDSLFVATDSLATAQNGISLAATGSRHVEIAPGNIAAGPYTVEVPLYDLSGRVSTVGLSVSVTNQPPGLVPGIAQDTTVTLSGGAFGAAISATDPEGFPTTVEAASSAPTVAGATISGDMLEITPQAAGQTTITLTAHDGVQTTQATFTLTVEANTGLQAGPGPEIRLYPNPLPAGRQLQIQGIAPGTYTCKVVSLGGQTMHTQKLAVPHTRPTAIPVITPTPGAYILQIQNPKNTYTIRFTAE